MIHLISIIIPAYNSEKTISKTIESLLKQNYSKKNYEIIIVDDGSIDNTQDTILKFKQVRLIKQNHKGPATARNLGARNAKGDILLFTDADCILDKNWIKEMVKPFTNPEIIGVSGTYKTLNNDNFMARFIGYEIEERHERMKRQKFIDFIGTFSAAYRKKIFLKFGGFDTRFKTSSGEDPELSYRIDKAGLKMVFQPKAIVFHPHPNSLWKYLKQKYKRAVWRNLMYWGKHKEKIMSDSYTSKSMFLQIFLSGLVFLISLSLIILKFSITFSFLLFFVSLFTLTIIFNIKFLTFLLRKEKSIAFLSPFILILRNSVVILGIFEGLLKYALRKF